MPAFRDLTGQRFGKLVAVEYVGRIAGGQDGYWRCQCDCGTLTTIPRRRLSGTRGDLVRACEACRLSRQCAICETTFIPSSSRATTCSPECSRVLRTRNLVAAKARRDAARPDRLRAEQCRYRERLRKDPQRHEARKKVKREWYVANRDEILAERRRRRASMSDDERAAIREYMRRWHRELRADPDRHAAYLAMQTDRRREARLSELVRLGARLEMDRHDDN